MARPAKSSHMVPGALASTLLCCGLLAVVWNGLGCAGGFSGTTQYNYTKTCRYERVKSTVNHAGGFEAPPTLPSLAGAPLRKGTTRLGIEVNPLLLAPGKPQGPVDLATNWVPPALVGLFYENAATDNFSLGLHARHSLGFSVTALNPDASSESPQDGQGTFSGGFSGMLHLMAPDRPFVLSLLFEFGVRSRKVSVGTTDTYQEVCQVDCTATRGYSYEDTTSFTTYGDIWTDSGETVSREMVPDGTFGVQSSYLLTDGIRALFLATVQPRGMAVEPSIADDSREFKLYAVFQPAVGIDFNRGSFFAKAFLGWPIVLGDTLQYGPGVTFATGAQF